MDLAGKKIVLGLTGGIACYKAAEFTRALIKAGASVQVVMTTAASAGIESGRVLLVPECQARSSTRRAFGDSPTPRIVTHGTRRLLRMTGRSRLLPPARSQQFHSENSNLA